MWTTAGLGMLAALSGFALSVAQASAGRVDEATATALRARTDAESRGNECLLSEIDRTLAALGTGGADTAIRTSGRER